MHWCRGKERLRLKKRRYLFIIWCMFFSFCFLGCRAVKVKESVSLMGTFVEITVWDKDRANAYKAIEEAFQEMERVEHLASIFREDSEISEINRAGKAKLSSSLFYLIKQAYYVGDLTKGAFDITVSPLSSLWKEKIAKKEIPSQKDISQLLELVNYRDITFGDNNEISFRKKGVSIDLGGIAKGYAVDCAVSILKDYKIRNALVNAGGDIFVLGKNKTKKWSVALQHPRIKQEILGTIGLKNKAIFTSGDYESFFIKDEIRYHHIINPQTGYPSKECISVTILADNGSLADGLATGIFVLGPFEGMRLIESLSGVEGIIIDTKGEMIFSSGLGKSNIYKGEKMLLWK